MHRQSAYLILLLLFGASAPVRAQEFKVFDRSVQVHGFVSQGFVHTSNNNWLTLRSSNIGSGQFTDFGANASMQVTDKFRIGAQVYDRSLGQLGRWHPSLDWAFAQYKVKPWLGFRGGKVKTMVGLYNDTQDLDFLRTFALLPQGVYPIDVRDATLAHMGGDIFGDIRLRKKLGTLSYSAFAGQREDNLRGGYAYLMRTQGLVPHSMGGLQYGADLRWSTPLKGLLIGISRMNEDTEMKGTVATPFGEVPSHTTSRNHWTNQYYGQYSWKKLMVDAEYRRYLMDADVDTGGMPSRIQTDVRAWYIAGSYQVAKRVQFGSYYSRYWINSPAINGPLLTGTGHNYDKVVSGRVDLNRFTHIKVEGHFMDGYGYPQLYPNGFYLADNPQGLKPETNALVIKTGVNF